MTGRHTAVRPPGRGWVPAVVAVVGALGLVGGLGTQAYWNDTETVSGTTVTSGSLDLRVAGQDSYTWSALSISDLAPGESTAEALTLANAGTTPFSVSITASATASSPTMRDAVIVEVSSGAGASTTSATYPRAETCAGSSAYSGPLGGGATSVLGPSGTVAPGGTLVICVRLRLPTDAVNATQSQTYSPAFTVTATQAAS